MKQVKLFNCVCKQYGIGLLGIHNDGHDKFQYFVLVAAAAAVVVCTQY